MSHARARQGTGGPFHGLLFLLALAHNWAGIADAYFAAWNWAGTEIGHAIMPGPSGT